MNQKVSKWQLTRWVAMYAALLMFASILTVLMGNYMPAHAAEDKFVVYKRDSWSMNRTYVAPNVYNAGTHLETYKVTINTNYVYWPDAGHVDKIAIASGSVCYDRLLGNGALFQGVNGNPIWMDDNNVVNIGAIEVGENGASECTGFFISYPSRRWFRMGQDPAWGATGKIRIKFTPDDDFIFKWGGSDTKYFHPDDDPNVGDWFWCECDYPGSDH